MSHERGRNHGRKLRECLIKGSFWIFFLNHDRYYLANDVFELLGSALISCFEKLRGVNPMIGM